MDDATVKILIEGLLLRECLVESKVTGSIRKKIQVLVDNGGEYHIRNIWNYSGETFPEKAMIAIWCRRKFDGKRYYYSYTGNDTPVNYGCEIPF